MLVLQGHYQLIWRKVVRPVRSSSIELGARAFPLPSYASLQSFLSSLFIFMLCYVIIFERSYLHIIIRIFYLHVATFLILYQYPQFVTYVRYLRFIIMIQGDRMPAAQIASIVTFVTLFFFYHTPILSFSWSAIYEQAWDSPVSI